MSAFKDSLLEAEENAVSETEAPEINTVHVVDNAADYDALAATIEMASIDLSFTNTRRKLLQADIDALKASIQSVGLLSAVTVKPIGNGKYALIAGFKRYEAMKQLGKTHINAIVLDENADEAFTTEANLAENFNRSGLSLADQCTAIKRLFTVLEGDDADKTDIIAVRLNMTVKQVKDRLLLTALIDDAMIAFDDGKIALKTAIVLAGQPDEQQAEYLAKLVKGEMNHDQLLETLGQATVTLSWAKFDIAACQQCPSNSEVQGSLFSDNAGAGVGTCSNLTCFKTKSKAWFVTRRAELEAEYGTIIPVSQVEQSAISMLSADVLGETQLQQCASCSDNVSLIQNKMSEKFGNVMNNICRNKTCFTDCATKFANAQAEPDTNKDSSDTVDEVVATDDVGNDAAVEQPTNAAAKPATQKVAKATPAQSAKLSKAGIQSARNATAKIQIDKGLSEAVDSKMLMFLAVMRLTGDMMGYNVKNIAEVVSMDDATLRDKINNALLTYLAKGEKESGEDNTSYPVGNILLTLLSAKGQLEDAIIASWTVAELKHTTKAGIKQALTESGFKQHMEDKEKGSFNKLMGEKVPDIHKALEKTDFDFSQYAPQAYIDAVKKVAGSIS
tara:strand:- start:15057 stop:16907 length:1851 start_codon:yes stop_codon:yes gene_type:complete